MVPSARMQYVEAPVAPPEPYAPAKLPTPRQPRLTAELVDAIEWAARMGVRPRSIPTAVGLSQAEFEALVAQSDGVLQAIARGRALGELDMAAGLHSAGAAGDTKAALALLERSFGWQPPAPPGQTPPAGQEAAQLDVSQLSDAELSELKRLLQKAAPPTPTTIDGLAVRSAT